MTETAETFQPEESQDVEKPQDSEGISEPRESPESGKSSDSQNSDNPEPETFPREYVEKLRAEAAEARVKVKDRDDLAARLHTALVAATGRLADPEDLPFDQAHLDDPEALTAAVDALLEAKPHLASRKPTGDIGQGATTSPEAFDLLAALRANAS